MVQARYALSLVPEPEHLPSSVPALIGGVGACRASCCVRCTRNSRDSVVLDVVGVTGVVVLSVFVSTVVVGLL